MAVLAHRLHKLLAQLPEAPPHTYAPPARTHAHRALAGPAAHTTTCPHTASPAAGATVLTGTVPPPQEAPEALEDPEHHPHASRPAERRTAA